MEIFKSSVKEALRCKAEKIIFIEGKPVVLGRKGKKKVVDAKLSISKKDFKQVFLFLLGKRKEDSFGVRWGALNIPKIGKLDVFGNANRRELFIYMAGSSQLFQSEYKLYLSQFSAAPAPNMQKSNQDGRGQQVNGSSLPNENAPEQSISQESVTSAESKIPVSGVVPSENDIDLNKGAEELGFDENPNQIQTAVSAANAEAAESIDETGQDEAHESVADPLGSNMQFNLAANINDADRGRTELSDQDAAGASNDSDMEPAGGADFSGMNFSMDSGEDKKVIEDNNQEGSSGDEGQQSMFELGGFTEMENPDANDEIRIGQPQAEEPSVKEEEQDNLSSEFDMSFANSIGDDDLLSEESGGQVSSGAIESHEPDGIESSAMSESFDDILSDASLPAVDPENTGDDAGMDQMELVALPTAGSKLSEQKNKGEINALEEQDLTIGFNPEEEGLGLDFDNEDMQDSDQEINADPMPEPAHSISVPEQIMPPAKIAKSPPQMEPKENIMADAKPAHIEIDYGPDDPTLNGDYKEVPIDRLLKEMIKMGSSDLHLTHSQPIIFRVDGEITRLKSDLIDSHAMKSFIDPILPDRNREEFARCNDTDFAYAIPEIGRFRVNLFRDRNGVGLVIRHIPDKILTMEQLNLPPVCAKFAQLHKGLILVTGPTGSGKSTTLAAILDHINKTRKEHLITIEDPIEFVHPQYKCLINQREVHKHTNTFSAALRAALREDPDIVLIGELRDLETIAIAIETAETGHLVFGTLHTTTAKSTVDRLIDQFPSDQQAQIRTMLASSLKGVISQTLLKKKGGGRCAAQEILVSDAAVAAMIREGKIHMIDNHLATQKKAGNMLLNDALINLVKEGKADPMEAFSKSIDKKNFIASCQKHSIKLTDEVIRQFAA